MFPSNPKNPETAAASPELSFTPDQDTSKDTDSCDMEETPVLVRRQLPDSPTIIPESIPDPTSTSPLRLNAWSRGCHTALYPQQQTKTIVINQRSHQIACSRTPILPDQAYIFPTLDIHHSEHNIFYYPKIKQTLLSLDPDLLHKLKDTTALHPLHQIITNICHALLPNATEESSLKFLQNLKAAHHIPLTYVNLSPQGNWIAPGVEFSEWLWGKTGVCRHFTQLSIALYLLAMENELIPVGELYFVAITLEYLISGHAFMLYCIKESNALWLIDVYNYSAIWNINTFEGQQQFINISSDPPEQTYWMLMDLCIRYQLTPHFAADLSNTNPLKLQNYINPSSKMPISNFLKDRIQWLKAQSFDTHAFQQCFQPCNFFFYSLSYADNQFYLHTPKSITPYQPFSHFISDLLTHSSAELSAHAQTDALLQTELMVLLSILFALDAIADLSAIQLHTGCALSKVLVKFLPRDVCQSENSARIEWLLKQRTYTSSSADLALLNIYAPNTPPSTPTTPSVSLQFSKGRLRKRADAPPISSPPTKRRSHLLSK